MGLFHRRAFVILNYSVYYQALIAVSVVVDAYVAFEKQSEGDDVDYAENAAQVVREVEDVDKRQPQHDGEGREDT